ncbi:hypothetical protein ARMGADRAFT_542368 [Armillaria gallica]|uniref:Uncharacterized protein n=1 Tax=Armillaria gallica TaxID=47427 RepID=A0A2H3DAJ1_ARMGA|nr:hypothetical protein ARMGADRAFT_542368 [Armillaria gallica]
MVVLASHTYARSPTLRKTKPPLSALHYVFTLHPSVISPDRINREQIRHLRMSTILQENCQVDEVVPRLWPSRSHL